MLPLVEQHVRSLEVGCFEISTLPEQDHLFRVDFRTHLEADEVDAARDLRAAAVRAVPGDRVLAAR